MRATAPRLDKWAAQHCFGGALLVGAVLTPLSHCA